MTESIKPQADLLAKAGDPDFRRHAFKAVLKILIEADVDGKIGVTRHERSGERVNYLNGYLDRSLDTRVGDTRVGELHLRIPKLP
jgi:putative transposase